MGDKARDILRNYRGLGPTALSNDEIISAIVAAEMEATPEAEEALANFALRCFDDPTPDERPGMRCETREGGHWPDCPARLRSAVASAIQRAVASHKFHSDEIIHGFAEQMRGLEAELVKARRDRDLAIAHDRQPYPTAEAYEKVCATLNKHKDELAELRARPFKCPACYYTGAAALISRGPREGA